MKKIIYLLILLFVNVGMFAQINNSDVNKVMLKGKVLGGKAKAPVDAKITFKESTGKEINTNSNNGKYELLLDANKKYDVFINGKSIIRYTDDFEYKAAEKYTEATHDFFVSLIEEGAVLKHIKSPFSGQELNQSIENDLEEVKKIMRFNRNINISVYILSNSPESDAAINKLNKLKDHFGQWKRFKNKIETIEIKESFEGISASTDASDLFVIISSVKDPFGG